MCGMLASFGAPGALLLAAAIVGRTITLAINIINADLASTVTANTTGDIWVVNAGVNVTTTGDAFDGTGASGDRTFLISGHLIAEADGIHLGDGTGGNRIDILSSGSIFAENHAVESSGGLLDLTNEGNIFSIKQALMVAGSYNVVANTGTITSSHDLAIEADGDFNSIGNGGAITGYVYAIFSGGSAQITNTGTLSSQFIGIGASPFTDSGNGGHNNIANAGTLSTGATAILSSFGSSNIINTGTITSGGYGISANGGNNIINNSGNLSAGVNGIDTQGSGNLIVNSGSLTSSDSAPADGAVNIASVRSETNRLVNNGEINSPYNAVVGGSGNETVTNRGIMNGNVELGGGRDALRNGGDVLGDVNLGSGNDLFKGWDGAVEGSIFGGNGKDTITGGISDDAIFGNAGADVLKGGQGDDILTGGAGRDLMRGGEGDDTLTGGAGRDLMRGGLGADTFDFNAIGESTAGAQRDHLLDFTKGEDVIDLHTIDAKPGVAGNQDFTFINNAAFSGAGGELRAANSGSNSIISGDTNGDGTADVQMLLVGVNNLTEADFVL